MDWHDISKMVRAFGWAGAVRELKSRAAFFVDEERSEALLQIATVEQKFGSLAAAEATLQEICNSSPSSFLTIDAKLRLAKVYSQQGKHKRAREIYAGTTEPIIFGRKDTFQQSDSAIWRTAFQQLLGGQTREAEYAFDFHLECAGVEPSQLANNILFQEIARGITQDDTSLKMDRIETAFSSYVLESIDNPNVKFLDLHKSLVVPMLYNSVVLLERGDFYTARKQAEVARRLMQASNIGFSAEGIGEFFTASRTTHPKGGGQLELMLQSSGETSEYDKSSAYISQEASEIIGAYILDGEAQSLLYRTEFKRGKKGNKMKRILIIHGHDMANTLLLRNFIAERTSGQPCLVIERPDEGKTLIEKFESEALQCDAAIALFTKDDVMTKGDDEYFQPRPNVLFEIGWFFGRKKRSNVVIAFQSGVSIPSDLDGLARKQFSDKISEIFLPLKDELGI